MNPPLKWVGSKRWHVAEVAQHYRGERLVELFCGSAAVAFGLEVEQALLNDANPHLINFYKHAGDLADFSGTTNEKEYRNRREMFNRKVKEGQTAFTAGLFYYLNSTAFNNLWRVNQSGEFNVPFRKGRENVPKLGTVIPSAWEFTNDDFRDVLLEADDFVYADPPYVGTFDDYTTGGFSLEDFQELALLLITHPGRVILMNSAVPEVLEYCEGLGYHLTLLESGQRMQASRGRKDKIQEVMVTNFAC